MNPITLFFVLWLRGLLFYALFTLPSLFIPEMYFISFALGAVGGLIASIALILYVLSIIPKMKYEDDRSVLTQTIIFGLIFTFLSTIAVSIYITQQSPFSARFWYSYGTFILFPIAGLCAALTSIWSNRYRIMDHFNQ